jgi:hypothetical protein
VARATMGVMATMMTTRETTTAVRASSLLLAEPALPHSQPAASHPGGLPSAQRGTAQWGWCGLQAPAAGQRVLLHPTPCCVCWRLCPPTPSRSCPPCALPGCTLIPAGKGRKYYDGDEDFDGEGKLPPSVVGSVGHASLLARRVQPAAGPAAAPIAASCRASSCWDCGD